MNVCKESSSSTVSTCLILFCMSRSGCNGMLHAGAEKFIGEAKFCTDAQQ